MSVSPWIAGSAAAALVASFAVSALAQTPPDEVRPLREPVEQFVSYMVQTHGFDRTDLRARNRPAGQPVKHGVPRRSRPSSVRTALEPSAHGLQAMQLASKLPGLAHE